MCLVSHSIRLRSLCGGRAPLPAGGRDHRSLWKEEDLRSPREAGLKVQAWHHSVQEGPSSYGSVHGGHLFLADFISRVPCGPRLGIRQKAMAGWKEARPFSWGRWLEHSTEVGLTFKLHTVTQWGGESTDEMDPNQP